MNLVNIGLGALTAAAGGDPWEINASLQHGRPGQIDNLATAYKSAGQSTAEADTAFAQARQRFEHAWSRDNGEHPINDAQPTRAQRLIEMRNDHLAAAGARDACRNPFRRQ